MSKRVLKWDVPVDDLDHPIGSGRVVHVACQGTPTVVQVWTEEPENNVPHTRRARVYGTGQPIDDSEVHVGAALTSLYVWHVYAAPGVV